MSLQFVQTPAIALYTGMSPSATSCVVTPYPVDIQTGRKLLMADFGSIGYFTIDPKVSGIEEICSFTGITDNGNNTATLTGLTRNLIGESPYTTPGTGKQHGSSAVLVFSNNPQIYASFLQTSQLDTDPTLAANSDTEVSSQKAIKTYIANVITGIAGVATNLLYGTVKMTTATSNIAVATDDTRVPTQGESDALAGTSGTPSSSNKYVTNDDVSSSAVSGKIIRASGTSLPPLDGSALLNITISNNFTAFQDITSGQAVSIGNGTVITLPTQTLNVSNSVNEAAVNGTNFVAITFTPTINGYISSISLSTRQTQNGGQPAATTTLKIKATSGGNPSGAAIDTATNTDNTYTAGITQRTYTFSGTTVLTAGTTYALELSTSAGNYEMWGNRTSTDSGSTWTTPTLNTTPAHVLTYKQTITAGQIFPSSSTTNDSAVTFLGFAATNISIGNSGKVFIGGIATGLSGLTAGSYYYLNNTPGTIGTSTGSTSRKVGLAITSTSLLITNIW